MILFALGVTIVYVLTISWLIYGFTKINSFKYTGLPPKISFTIIVPFRNEEDNLLTLIESLRKLDYPEDQFEILLIDDQSNDNSLSKAKQLTDHLPNFKIISIRSAGKKLAIAQGIELSKGEIIITTDADCELPADWLRSVNSQFQNQSIQMIAGAVAIRTDKTFFSKLQAVEFSSLIGSAAATLALGFPTMCNGANLSYRKKAFMEVHGFLGNEQIASGDDEFLMQKIVKKFGTASVKFLMDSNAVVTTHPQFFLKDFLAQRIRWAGKWKHNLNWTAKTLAVFVLLFQLSWLMALAFLFFQPSNNTILLLLVVKMLLEGFFLFGVFRFMRQKFSVSAFLFLQLTYPFYVIAVGILSTFITVSWKGRPVQSKG